MQTIMADVRTSLLSSLLPHSYWLYAALWSIQMRNVLPRRRDGEWMSPWIETRGYKPDVTGLRAFGADAWVHRPNGQRKAGKLGSTSEPGAPGVLVMYDISTRLYTIDTVEYGIMRSMTCTFDEDAIMARVHARPADALRTSDATQQQGVDAD